MRPTGICLHCGRVTVPGPANKLGRITDICKTCARPAISPPEDYNTAETRYGDGCGCQPLPEHRIAQAMDRLGEVLRGFRDFEGG